MYNFYPKGIHNFLYDLYNILLLLWRHPNLLVVICEVLLFLLLSLIMQVALLLAA